MIVAIDQNICTGCRECAEVCPAYAIVGEQGKPQTIDTDRCVMCGQCVQKCKSYVSVLTHGKDAYERVKRKKYSGFRSGAAFCSSCSLPPERGEGSSCRQKQIHHCAVRSGSAGCHCRGIWRRAWNPYSGKIIRSSSCSWL